MLDFLMWMMAIIAGIILLISAIAIIGYIVIMVACIFSKSMREDYDKACGKEDNNDD